MSKYCSNCGYLLDESSEFCPSCGINLNNYLHNFNKNITDKGGIALGILGFIFPIVGLILYLILKDTKPKNAKSAGKGALISVITGVVIYVAIMVLFGIIFNVMASNL